jgi:protein-L-isoaspartate(D-aspartate) O-methyltransferase
MKRNRKSMLLLLALLATLAAAAVDEETQWRRLREAMVRDTIAASSDRGDPVRNRRVLDAMRTTPRHQFVPYRLRDQAYQDHPVPIGRGQTISQPYMVAKMTELLRPQPGHRILELGTGSGYQAAVLSPLVEEIYTIEIIEPLGVAARQRLRRLGYQNIHVKVGDGYYGWPEQGPFDGIIVTAWATHVPPPLLDQLKPGGRMIIPVGNALYQQNLVVVHKGKGRRDLRMEAGMPVVFVPLTGGHDRPSR